MFFELPNKTPFTNLIETIVGFLKDSIFKFRSICQFLIGYEWIKSY